MNVDISRRLIAFNAEKKILELSNTNGPEQVSFVRDKFQFFIGEDKNF